MKTYYRCTMPNHTERISTNHPIWDNNLFCSKSLELAKAYGTQTEIIKSKDDAKIITEQSNGKGFKELKIKPKQYTMLLDYCIAVITKAKEYGYDIVEFEKQGDIGTVILNTESVIRNAE